MSSADAVAWGGHERGSIAYRRILIALLCAGIATFAQLYGPQGILPLITKDLGISASQASLIMSAPTTGLAFSVLPWSLVADRIGRLQAMRIALISATLFGLVLPWFRWFEVVIAFRFLEGAALGGIPAIAITYLANEVSKRDLAIAAGSYISGTSIGGLTGRLIAAPVADLANWRLGMFAVAVICGAMVAVFMLVTPTARGFAPHHIKARTVLRAIGMHIRNPKLLVLYAQAFLLMGGFVAIYNYLSFRLEGAPFFIPPGIASLLFLAYLAGTVSTRFTAAAVGRYGRGRSLSAALIAMIAGTLLTLAPSLISIIAGLLILTAGFFGAHSVALAWSDIRPTSHRGQSSSLYYLSYYAGSGVFGYLGGIAWAHAGWPGVAGMVIGLILIAFVWALIAARDDR